MGNCCYLNRQKTNDLNLNSILSFKERRNNPPSVTIGINKNFIQNQKLNQNSNHSNNYKSPGNLINKEEHILMKKKETKFKAKITSTPSLEKSEKNENKDVNLFGEIDRKINSPRFRDNAMSMRDINPEEFLNFSLVFLEEFNSLRKDCMFYANKLRFYLDNFEYLISTLKNSKKELKKDFEISKEDLIISIEFLTRLSEERKKEKRNLLNELKLEDELKLNFPERIEDMFNLKYYKNCLKMIKVKSKSKFNIEKLDCQVVSKNPEISFVLYVVDKILENDTKAIFMEDMKYLGVNCYEYDEDSLLMCIILSC